MKPYQQEFINLSIAAKALRFGEFTLKSGRTSPYFFNAGQFSSGQQLAVLGQCYANKIVDSGLAFDMLFGPAYKGISLAAATAISLARDHGLDIPFAFNRKEAKKHGEGGSIVGAGLSGRVLIIDDVITAGTAIREVFALLDEIDSADVTGVVIGLDRQERGKSQASAIDSLTQEFDIQVESIITLEHLIEYLSKNPSNALGDSGAKLLERMQIYQRQYASDAIKQ